MGVANMETLTISQIKRAALEGRVEAVVHGQVDTLLKKETGLPVFHSEEPISGTVMGAGTALEKIDLLQQVALGNQ